MRCRMLNSQYFSFFEFPPKSCLPSRCVLIAIFSVLSSWRRDRRLAKGRELASEYGYYRGACTALLAAANVQLQYRFAFRLWKSYLGLEFPVSPIWSRSMSFLESRETASRLSSRDRPNIRHQSTTALSRFKFERFQLDTVAGG